MKKLMIVTAVALAASFANAAAVNWSGSNVTRTGVDSAPTAWTVVLMDNALTSQADLATAFASKDADTIKNAISAGTVLSTAGINVGTATGRWNVSGGSLPSAYVQGNTVQFYTLILDQAVPDKGDANYFISQTVGGTVSDSTNLGMTFGSQAGKSWTSYTVGASPVPEPTTGMLVLLGVAGLALRRRRA